MIGILEICVKNHSVLVDSWIIGLREKGHKTILFTTADIVANVSEKPDFIEVKSTYTPIFFFLKKVEFLIRKYKVRKLIITSIQLHYIEILLSTFKTEVWITIHNAATWFGDEDKSLKGFLKGKVKRGILRKASAIIVGSNNIKQYIISSYLSTVPIYVFPFTLYSKERMDNSFVAISDNKLIVVIPGGLSKLRKRYDRLIEASTELKEKLKLVFLGSPVKNEGGIELIQELKERQESGLDIKVYSSHVENNEFDFWLSKADILFNDINVEINRHSYREIYGKTKDAGITYIMISKSLPGIVNSSFCNHPELLSSTLYFDNANDLLDILIKITEQHTFLQYLKEEARLNSKSFTIDKIEVLDLI